MEIKYKNYFFQYLHTRGYGGKRLLYFCQKRFECFFYIKYYVKWRNCKENKDIVKWIASNFWNFYEQINSIAQTCYRNSLNAENVENGHKNIIAWIRTQLLGNKRIADSLERKPDMLFFGKKDLQFRKFSGLKRA